MKDPESQVEELILVLAEMHGKEMSPAFIVIYKRALLSALSPDEALMALNLAFTRKTYGFPKPYDLIEMVRGNGEDQALEAWEELNRAIQHIGPYRSVTFADGNITRVVEALGGWIEVNGWTVDETKFRRQEFMKLYKASMGGSAEAKRLSGLHEIENAARGYIKHIPEAVLVGSAPQVPPAARPSRRNGSLSGAVQQLLEHMDPSPGDGLN